MAPTTITFRTDRGVIAYSAMERPETDEPGGVAGGLLGGEPALVAIVREILAGSLPKTVRVAEPNLEYVFSERRDTLADVAAAMLVAGNGRGRLSTPAGTPSMPPWTLSQRPTPTALSSTDWPMTDRGRAACAAP